MKALKLASLLALAIAIVGGCVLVSGQFIIDWALKNMQLTQTTLDPEFIDLNEESVYRDHKDGLKGLVDLAFVGFVTNNLGTAAQATVYITPAQTNFTSRAALLASGQATRLWGDFPIAANQVDKKIEWDESAALFDAAGKDVLLGEIKGDGSFTLYIMGAGNDNFDINTKDAYLILVVDAQE
jgi:hypothetical protein